MEICKVSIGRFSHGRQDGQHLLDVDFIEAQVAEAGLGAVVLAGEGDLLAHVRGREDAQVLEVVLACFAGGGVPAPEDEGEHAIPFAAGFGVVAFLPQVEDARVGVGGAAAGHDAEGAPFEFGRIVEAGTEEGDAVAEFFDVLAEFGAVGGLFLDVLDLREFVDQLADYGGVHVVGAVDHDRDIGGIAEGGVVGGDFLDGEIFQAPAGLGEDRVGAGFLGVLDELDRLLGVFGGGADQNGSAAPVGLYDGVGDLHALFDGEMGGFGVAAVGGHTLGAAFDQVVCEATHAVQVDLAIFGVGGGDYGEVTAQFSVHGSVLSVYRNG